jgi:hypothetical protein
LELALSISSQKEGPGVITGAFWQVDLASTQ